MASQVATVEKSCSEVTFSWCQVHLVLDWSLRGALRHEVRHVLHLIQHSAIIVLFLLFLVLFLYFSFLTCFFFFLAFLAIFSHQVAWGWLGEMRLRLSLDCSQGSVSRQVSAGSRQVRRAPSLTLPSCLNLESRWRFWALNPCSWNILEDFRFQVQKLQTQSKLQMPWTLRHSCTISLFPWFSWTRWPGWSGGNYSFHNFYSLILILKIGASDNLRSSLNSHSLILCRDLHACVLPWHLGISFQHFQQRRYGYGCRAH